MIGSGWRAEFFLRIARYLPDRFRILSVLVRDPEKGRLFAERWGVKVVNDLDSLLAEAPEFVVVSVRKGCARGYIERLCERGVPVFCETPPVCDLPALTELWQTVQALRGDVQVAEQYLWQPLYAAWSQVIGSGLLGEVQNMSLSALHGYHGVSVIRHWLGTGYAPCQIWGKRCRFPVTKTGGREGACYTGEVVLRDRDRLTLEWEDGRAAFFDFDGIQYHSSIRTRQLNVQGPRG